MKIEDKEYLKLCLKYFRKLHKIQEKEVYSYLEISTLVKDIESNIDKFHKPNSIEKSLEFFYKNLPSNDLGYHMAQLSMLRYTFHKPLKEAGIDPLLTNPKAVELYLLA